MGDSTAEKEGKGAANNMKLYALKKKRTKKKGTGGGISSHKQQE